MVTILKYDITGEGKWLNVHIKVNPSFNNVYIKSLSISTEGTLFNDHLATVTIPALLIAKGYNLASKNVKEISLSIDLEAEDLVANPKPLFMQIKAEDPLSEATTCAYKSTIYDVAIDKYPIYKSILCLTNKLTGCEDSQNLIDRILRLNALEASIKVYNVDRINEYYKWFINNPAITAPSCGCKNY